jgi:superfamily I DNA/RNA helicase
MQRKTNELDQEAKPAWVGTFHKFAMELGVSAGLMDQTSDQWSDLQRTMLEAVSKLEAAEKFDAWIVDEAQDFHDSWWQVLEASLKNPEDGRLAIFGDPDQSVYSQRGFPEGHFAIVRLSENLRNCHQIAESVRQFIDAPMSSRGPLSYEVEYVEVPSYEDVIGAADDVVGRLVDEELWDVGEIALLTTMHQHPVHKENLEAGKEAFWDSLWEGTDVFYSTSNGFKGLERSAIVLAIDGFHDPSKREDVLYVGMTRARDRLVVVGTKENLSFIQATHREEI